MHGVVDRSQVGELDDFRVRRFAAVGFNADFERENLFLLCVDITDGRAFLHQRRNIFVFQPYRFGQIGFRQVVDLAVYLRPCVLDAYKAGVCRLGDDIEGAYSFALHLASGIVEGEP